jgi:hypothetical protein
MWWWQCSEVGADVWMRTFNKRLYLRRYNNLKNRLVEDMKLEGLIDLGKRVAEFMAETGLTIESPEEEKET